MMKKSSLIAVAMAATTMATATTVYAEDTSSYSLTSNVGIFSQYVFRGITYSDRRPALQGGFDFAHNSGWYAGVWGSSLEEGDNAGNSLEVDLYGGYTHQFTDDLGIDVGLLQFYYPDHKKYNGENFDTTEAHIAMTWKWFTAKYNRTLTDWGGVNNHSAGIDGYANGDTKGTEYYQLDFNYGLPMDINLTMHVGRLDVPHYSAFNYTDYLIGVSKSFAIGHTDGWTVGVNYTDTNADKAWWTSVSGKNRGDSQWIAYLSRSF